MKKALLVFCVIVGVANGKCVDCPSISCVDRCEEEDTVESLGRAIHICASLDFAKQLLKEEFVGQLCNSVVEERLRRRKSELEQQARQEHNKLDTQNVAMVMQMLALI